MAGEMCWGGVSGRYVEEVCRGSVSGGVSGWCVGEVCWVCVLGWCVGEVCWGGLWGGALGRCVLCRGGVLRYVERWEEGCGSSLRFIIRIPW